MTARAILATREPVLIFQPALYMLMVPNSNPTIAIPSINAVQLRLTYSVAKFFTGLVKKYNIIEDTEPMKYVIPSEASGLIDSGVDFVHM